MSLTITTPDADALRAGILERLGQRAVEGWETDGESFTLTDPEWGGNLPATRPTSRCLTRAL
ncbi:MAG TPA: hypothetical protein VNK04_03120 [Gemmataceae bacterium]|nr:hypothetical protein [Gemmataceae bacterium]